MTTFGSDPGNNAQMHRVCQFIQNPLEQHWQVVKRILRYLSSLEYGLHLKKSTSLDSYGFCDGDQVIDVDDKRSTSTYYVYLGSNLVSWFSKKQHTISRSLIEVEYKRLASIVAKMKWLWFLLGELRITIFKSPFYGVTMSTLFYWQLIQCYTLGQSTSSWICILLQKRCYKKIIEVQHVLSIDQITKIFTKSISSSRFPFLRHKLKVEDLSILSLRGVIKKNQLVVKSIVISFQTVIFSRMSCTSITRLMELLEGRQNLVSYLNPSHVKLSKIERMICFTTQFYLQT